jgi:hypothetical protein
MSESYSGVRCIANTGKPAHYRTGTGYSNPGRAKTLLFIRVIRIMNANRKHIAMRWWLLKGTALFMGVRNGFFSDSIQNAYFATLLAFIRRSR